MHPLTFNILALREMHKGFAWYRERNERAALRFLDAFWTAVDEVAEYPQRWPFLDRKHQFRPLKRFPFFLVYRCEDEVVKVVALAHGKRRPGYWKRRR